jgi:hypothetical protein
MSDLDSPIPLLAVLTYTLGALSAALFGDTDIIVDVLAGSGLGALFAQLVILRRVRRGVHGREPQIIAAWTAAAAFMTLAATLLVELL